MSTPPMDPSFALLGSYPTMAPIGGTLESCAVHLKHRLSCTDEYINCYQGSPWPPHCHSRRMDHGHSRHHGRQTWSRLRHGQRTCNTPLSMARCGGIQIGSHHPRRCFPRRALMSASHARCFTRSLKGVGQAPVPAARGTPTSQRCIRRH